jgi:hypothetical protein
LILLDKMSVFTVFTVFTAIVNNPDELPIKECVNNVASKKPDTPMVNTVNTDIERDSYY